METSNLSKEAAALLEAKEEWARQAAEAVVARGVHSAISSDIALNGARCAVFWIDAFKEIAESGEVADVEVALSRSFHEAVGKSEGLLRYPTSGELAIVSLIAVNEAFILGFEADERKQVRKLVYNEAKTASWSGMPPKPDRHDGL